MASLRRRDRPGPKVLLPGPVVRCRQWRRGAALSAQVRFRSQKKARVARQVPRGTGRDVGVADPRCWPVGALKIWCASRPYSEGGSSFPCELEEEFSQGGDEYYQLECQLGPCAF